MIERLSSLKLKKKFLIQTALLVAGGAALYFYADRRGLSYRELIVVFSALLIAVIAFGGELGIRLGFVLWVLTLALGYRTFQLTPDWSITPAEVLLWLLLACILVQRRMVASARLSFPIWLWLLVPFWVLAWWPLISGAMPWDRMLNEFRNFVLLIPLMIVAPVVLQRERYWRYLLLAFFLASSGIAVMGIVEYWLPEVARVFPAFISKASIGLTDEGFARANFSFWGGPPATFVCALALPVALVLATWWRTWVNRAFIITASVLQMVAIYIGGYRSIWLILVIQVTVVCLLRLKRQGAMVALLCVIFAVGGYELVPRTSERVMSGVSILRGQPLDSSGYTRQMRALGALKEAMDAPFGSGWSSAGWVHSDFLQVAVNLGLAAGLVFLGGYIFTMVRLGRRALAGRREKGEQSDLGLALMVSMIAAGGILAMEGVSVLPQLVLPVWFVWALTEVWLRRTAEESSVDYVRATPAPYRWAPAPLASRLKTDG